MNVANYPKSANALDSFGDFYKQTGDKVNAVKYYKQSLLIEEIPETKKKLKQGQGKQIEIKIKINSIKSNFKT